MKVNVLATFVRRACDRVESVCRRGRVRVVSIQCRQCGNWVNPSAWDPQKAVCDACACFAVRPVLKPQRQRRASRSGGAR